MTELSAEDKEVRICYIDAFSIGSEAEFYRTFASQVIACASSKIERWIEDAKKFLTGVVHSSLTIPERVVWAERGKAISNARTAIPIYLMKLMLKLLLCQPVFILFLFQRTIEQFPFWHRHRFSIHIFRS